MSALNASRHALHLQASTRLRILSITNEPELQSTSSRPIASLQKDAVYRADSFFEQISSLRVVIPVYIGDS